MSDAALPTTSSYRSGEWFGVFGEQATVLLPPDAKARVAGLWELADAGSDFDELLDGLIAGGLRELAGFVLVSTGEEPTRALVRGEITVELRLADGETVAVDGRAAATWVERTVSGVQSVHVDLGDTEGEELPIRTGLVRVARVHQPITSGPARPPVTDQTTEVPPPPPPPVDPVARLLFSDGQAVEVDRPVLVGRAPDPRGVDAPEQPRLIPVPSPNQEISSTHLLVRPGSGGDEGFPVVTDLDSTNGTLVVLPGQPPEELSPGVAVRLIPGTVIDVGDGLTVQVTGL